MNIFFNIILIVWRTIALFFIVLSPFIFNVSGIMMGTIVIVITFCFFCMCDLQLKAAMVAFRVFCNFSDL